MIFAIFMVFCVVVGLSCFVGETEGCDTQSLQPLEAIRAPQQQHGHHAVLAFEGWMFGRGPPRYRAYHGSLLAFLFPLSTGVLVMFFTAIFGFFKAAASSALDLLSSLGLGAIVKPCAGFLATAFPMPSLVAYGTMLLVWLAIGVFGIIVGYEFPEGAEKIFPSSLISFVATRLIIAMV